MNHAAVTVSIPFFNHRNISITTIDFNMKSFKMQSFPVSGIYCIYFHKFNDHHCGGDYCYYEVLKEYGYFLINNVMPTKLCEVIHFNSFF